jgi:Uma2 family endonuclease
VDVTGARATESARDDYTKLIVHWGRLGMKTRLHLTPKDHGRPLTIDELESAGGKGGYQYELIDGRLVISPLPNLPHDVIRDWVAGKLWDYFRTHRDIVNHLHAPARVHVPGRQAVTAPEPVYGL